MRFLDRSNAPAAPESAMILTLTGNLLAERTLEFSRWAAGKTQRAQTETFQVGGKGINVSKMLHRIGTPTTAWCFAGGAAGDESTGWLRTSGIPFRTFPTTSPTRTGVVIRTPDQAETTFLAPDRPPDPAALRALAEALNQARAPGVFAALCGSFPGFDSDAAAPLRDALQHWVQEGVCALDSYGPPLRWAVERPLALVKINRDEFDGLFPEAERNRPVLERLTVATRQWPVRSWIITDGPRSVCYGGVDTPPAQQMPPPVAEVSATGSGDVLFACVLHAQHTLKVGLAEAVSFALPFAAANAAHPGVAEFDLNLLPSRRSVHA
jgi:1-phosphofructokinase